MLCGWGGDNANKVLNGFFSISSSNHFAFHFLSGTKLWPIKRVTTHSRRAVQTKWGKWWELMLWKEELFMRRGRNQQTRSIACATQKKNCPSSSLASHGGSSSAHRKLSQWMIIPLACARFNRDWGIFWNVSYILGVWGSTHQLWRAHQVSEERVQMQL